MESNSSLGSTSREILMQSRDFSSISTRSSATTRSKSTSHSVTWRGWSACPEPSIAKVMTSPNDPVATHIFWRFAMLSDKLNQIAPAIPGPATNRKGDWTLERLLEMLEFHYTNFKGYRWKYTSVTKSDSRFDGNLIVELEGCPCCDRGERYGS